MIKPTVYVRLSNRLLESLVTRLLREQHFDLLSELSSDFQPHILLTDGLPDSFTLPQAMRIVLIVDRSSASSLQVIRGLAGLLCLDCDEEEVLRCLRIVGEGGQFFSLSLMNYLNQAPTSQPTGGEGATPLTRREREIFNLVQQGKTSKQIAEELFISQYTAENHCANIREKLGLNGRNSLVRYAAKSVSRN